MSKRIEQSPQKRKINILKLLSLIIRKEQIKKTVIKKEVNGKMLDINSNISLIALHVNRLKQFICL